jgi:hypothetical protein
MIITPPFAAALLNLDLDHSDSKLIRGHKGLFDVRPAFPTSVVAFEEAPGTNVIPLDGSQTVRRIGVYDNPLVGANHFLVVVAHQDYVRSREKLPSLYARIQATIALAMIS